MNPPTLYILCGLPFSGKTTLAKKLAHSLGYALVAVDALVFAQGYDWVSKKISEKDLQRVLDTSYEQTLTLLQSGKSVVYDFANQEKEKREKLATLAKQQGFVSKIIHVDVPLSTIRKRWQENKKTQKRFDIAESVLNYAIDTYEPPSKDEGVITYTQDIDSEVWILKKFPIVMLRQLGRKFVKKREVTLRKKITFDFI